MQYLSRTTDLAALTDDDVLIRPGLRVFTNDWRWGTVTEPDRDGWWLVLLDGEQRPRSYNGERMTTCPPAGAPRDPQATRRPTHRVVFSFTDDPATYEVPVVAASRAGAEEQVLQLVTDFDFGHDPADLTILAITEA